MKTGDMIRVNEGWPGTRGRRFRVVEVTRAGGGRETVHALDKDGKHRWFPAVHCHVDRAETRARREA